MIAGRTPATAQQAHGNRHTSHAPQPPRPRSMRRAGAHGTGAVAAGACCAARSGAAWCVRITRIRTSPWRPGSLSRAARARVQPAAAIARFGNAPRCGLPAARTAGRAQIAARLVGQSAERAAGRNAAQDAAGDRGRSAPGGRTPGLSSWCACGTRGTGRAAERRRLAFETREILAPLANRLGVWKLKWELEDLAFRYLEPDEYQHIAARADERRVRPRALHRCGLRPAAGTSCRGRHRRAGLRPARSISTASGARCSASTSPSSSSTTCARCASWSTSSPTAMRRSGVVHGLWHYIPGEFDDYIATPKDNQYRSIHTAVIGPGRQVARGADPHPRDARARRTRRRRALALQGRRPRAMQRLRAQDRVGAPRARPDAQAADDGTSDLLERMQSRAVRGPHLRR